MTHPLHLAPLVGALLLASAPAFGGEEECISCCQAGGLSSCRPSIKVFGDGSLATTEKGAWRILGTWTVPCDGVARFDPGATAVMAVNPVGGEVMTAGTPKVALHCFRQSCALPEGACLFMEGEDRVRLLDCQTQQPIDGRRMITPARPPNPSGQVVVVGQRPLVVSLVEGDPVPAPPPTPTGVQEVEPPPPPTSSSLVIEVPAIQTAKECTTSQTLRAESRRRVDIGNDAVLAGQMQKAIDEYRAAIAMDACNAFAWADLGDAANKLDRPDLATPALKEAVRLNPRHYTAWTNLGYAYENLGYLDKALEAYQSALASRPDHAPAEEGRRRVLVLQQLPSQRP